MAIIDTVRRAGPFYGNGATTEFAFTFQLLEDEDIKVTSTDAAGVTTTLTLNSDFDVTITSDPVGGYITVTPAPATGATIWIVGDATYDQKLELFNQGPYRSEDVMAALDRSVVLIQQLRETLSRALVLPVEDGVFDFGATVAAITALAPHAAAIAALGGVIADLEALAGDISAIVNAAANAGIATAAAADATAAAADATAAAAAAAAALTALNGKITISTAAPSGGSEGDIWFRVM